MKNFFTTKIALILLVAVSLSSPAFAQNIQGIISDASTGRPLSNVNLALTGTTLITVSNRDGGFKLSPLKTTSKQNTFTLRASAIGYETVEKSVSLEESRTVVISLKPAIIQLNKELVVTAQRYEIPQFDSPEAISVRTATQLGQDAPRTAPEALMGTTGVWIQKTNHGGGSPFLRGLTGQQTLLMIDGIRLNNATFRSGPNQYLNTVDPQTIDRIEVLRGSGSVQYGSDALGGVVHLLTQDAQFSSEGWRVHGNAFAKYTSADMEKSGRAEIGLSNEKVALKGGLAYRDFGDILAGGDLGYQRPTGYKQLSGDFKGKIRVGQNHLLTVAYQLVNQDNVPLYHKVKLENFVYNQFDPQQRQLSYARWESYFDNKWAKSIQLTVLNQQWREGRQSQKNSSFTRVEEQDNVGTWGAILAVNAKPATYWSAASGIEYYTDQINSYRNDVQLQTGVVTAKRGLYPDGAKYSSLAAYSLHTFHLNRWTLAAGGRWNAFRISVKENTLGSSVITPSALVGNISALFAIHPQHHLTASVNTGFRAPNVDDMGTLGIVDFRYEVPNSNLKPEKSLNVEVGYKVKTERFAASLSVYQNFLTNMITRVRQGKDSIAGYPVYLKENTARAFIRGIEADAEVNLTSALVAYTNLTYTYGQNETANEPFRRIPPMNGLLGLRFQQAKGFWARAEWMAATKQDRLAGGDKDDNRIPKGGTQGWSIFNAYAGFRTSVWTLGVSLQNLGNVAYRTHGSGVNGYGRSVSVNGSVRF